MKKLVSALIAGALFATGAAQAQPGPQRAPAPHAAPAKATPVKAAPAKAAPGRIATPPKHWRKSAKEWQSHANRCQNKYRTYNPRTDRYSYRGRSLQCRL